MEMIVETRMVKRVKKRGVCELKDVKSRAVLFNSNLGSGSYVAFELVICGDNGAGGENVED